MTREKLISSCVYVKIVGEYTKEKRGFECEIKIQKKEEKKI
jgi:hypothetical protein